MLFYSRFNFDKNLKKIKKKFTTLIFLPTFQLSRLQNSTTPTLKCWFGMRQSWQKWTDNIYCHSATNDLKLFQPPPSFVLKFTWCDVIKLPGWFKSKGLPSRDGWNWLVWWNSALSVKNWDVGANQLWKLLALLLSHSAPYVRTRHTRNNTTATTSHSAYRTHTKHFPPYNCAAMMAWKWLWDCADEFKIDFSCAMLITYVDVHQVHESNETRGASGGAVGSQEGGQIHFDNPYQFVRAPPCTPVVLFAIWALMAVTRIVCLEQ
jgi:hypothetical protein